MANIAGFRSVGKGWRDALASRERKASARMLLALYDRANRPWTVGPLGGIYEFETEDELDAFERRRLRSSMWALGVFVAVCLGLLVVLAIAMLSAREHHQPALEALTLQPRQERLTSALCPTSPIRPTGKPPSASSALAWRSSATPSRPRYGLT